MILSDNGSSGNIVIIGGGTAGWLTALYAREALSRFGYKIVVVESSEIGILGAGEGTTPAFMSALDAIGISPFEIIQECGGTLKSGITFHNWSNRKFFSPFLSNEYCDPDFFFDNSNTFYEKYTDYSYIYGELANMSFGEYIFPNRLANKNLAPVGYRPLTNRQDDGELNDRFESFSNWALHFDARKLALFLKSKALDRKIDLIDARVIGFENNQDGEIVEIRLENDSSIKCEFLIDCSGFARLIIGKHFGSKWISYENRLAVDKAVPFFLPPAEITETYTQSIAMDYGWVWKIPTQERYGCGYVFDSSETSIDHIYQEISSSFGADVEGGKVFSFDAGTFDQVWIKNCLALGLSANFIEPLEATSIMQLILSLKRFLADPLNIKCRDEKIIRRFNQAYRQDAEEIVDFIQLHYFTKKTETSFWQDFQRIYEKSSFLEEILAICQFRVPNYDDFDKRNLFKLKSYLSILFGLGLVADEAIYNSLSVIGNSKHHEFVKLMRNLETFERLCLPNDDFLREVRESK